MLVIPHLRFWNRYCMWSWFVTDCWFIVDYWYVIDHWWWLTLMSFHWWFYLTLFVFPLLMKGIAMLSVLQLRPLIIDYVNDVIYWRNVDRYWWLFIETFVHVREHWSNCRFIYIWFLYYVGITIRGYDINGTL